MKTLLLLCGFVLGLSASVANAQWLTDFPAALKKAQAEDKAVLVNFTGSDWCGWCIRLKKEVFDTAEFKAFAAENLVLVEIDFPRAKQQSQALRQANSRLQTQYQVRGYPSIFILDKNGETRLKTGYQAGGPRNYITHLTRTKGITWRAAQPASAPAATKRSPAPPAQAKTPAPVPAATPAPARPAPPPPDELVLKGIVGSKNNRLALINDESFSPGQRGRVKLASKEVTLQCKEIRDNSVIVHVDGETEPRELKFLRKVGE
jgi:thiol-disulfide isomerase/thioredoxin